MVTKHTDIKGSVAESIVAKPNHKVDFNVAVEGYRGGRFAVLS